MERIDSDQFMIPEGVEIKKVSKHRYSEAEFKRLLDERMTAAVESGAIKKAKESLDRWIG